MVDTVEDWEGQGWPITDGTDISPVLPTTIGDAIIIGGGDTGQTAKHRDITGIDAALGGTYGAEFTVPGSTKTIFVQIPFTAPVHQPRAYAYLRQTDLGAVGASGLTSRGAQFQLFNGGLSPARIQLVNGGIQLFDQSSWKFLQPDQSWSTAFATMDTSIISVDTTYLVEFDWLSNTSVRVKLDGVVISDPHTINNAGPYDKVWVGNLRLFTGTVYAGNVGFGNPVDIPVPMAPSGPGWGFTEDFGG